MMLQWLILLTLFVHNSLAFGLYDDTDDYDLWRRQLGGPGVQPTPKPKSCHKDILIVLDSSQSVGALYFLYIQKFLMTLIEKLDVRKDGTQLGFITFSSAAKTKKLLDVGEKTDPTELKEWLKKLNYTEELMGEYTRTGLAFQIANNMFNQTSPSNARDTVEDVILLITDGEPHSPDGNEEERKVVETETNKLKKEKNVKIIGVAVGDFDLTYMEKWVTNSSEIEETSWETLDKDIDKLVNKLVNPLCTPGGECICKGGSGGTIIKYMKKGEITTPVEWPVPITCTGDASFTVDPPDTNSGDRFGLGKHVITYLSSYTNDAGNNVDLKCPVQVTVVGEFCGNTAYNPATQVCCCGKVFKKKTGQHRCCGQKYINPSKKMCCKGDRPVRVPGPCGP